MLTNAIRENDSFLLYEVAGGVYAAIEKGRSSGSNAGIIDLGEESVVFDSFVDIDAADELRLLCRELTGKEAAYVINSHSHADHIMGDCRFPESIIISSSATRSEMMRVIPEFESEKPGYAGEITKLETALSAATDATEIGDLKNSLFFLTKLVKPGAVMRAPDMAFDGELLLNGEKRTVRLIALEIAHTPGDVIAYLPEDGVCFMGDTLFQRRHPMLGRGDPEGLLKALRFILSLPAERYVPGHGQLAGRDDILLEMQYVTELLDLVQARRGGVKDYSVQDLSPAFRDWDGLCFAWNIKFLLGRLAGSAGVSA